MYGSVTVRWGRGNIVIIFFLLYVVIFSASCVIIAALKIDA